MKSKKFTLGLTIFYILALTWVIIFKLQFSFAELPHLRSVNLIPFGQPVILNEKTDVSKIIQNAAAFIPYGLFIRILWEKKSLLKQFVPIIFTSIMFEAIQFIFAIGASDITDVISNSSGGITGIFIAASIAKASGNNWIKYINIVSFTGAVIMALLIAALLLLNM